MKMSEYIGDLQACVELYGDLDVVEYREGQHGFNRSVRSPRLRSVVMRASAPHVEHAVSDKSVVVLARGDALIETGEKVYVI